MFRGRALSEAAGMLLSLLCVGQLALGAMFELPTEEVLKRSYDVIVVGAGAGGAVMASRLTEDPFIKVLLIEAGGSDFDNLNIAVPGRSGTLSRSTFDWNFTTTPQAGLNDRSVVYPRGFVLGGSTAINQMVFCRGTEDDYGRWAKVTGDPGWTFPALTPFILNVDRMTVPADHHNTTGQFNPLIHGKNGALPIGVEGFPLPTNPRVINTTRQLAKDFPFNLDYNSGNTIGVSWAQNTVATGHRVTSATSYLSRAINRPNLDILVNTRVTKVVSNGHVLGTPIMRGVQFAQIANGPTHTIFAKKEVILSAGSVNTPHILMLSGIGDAKHLSSFGIKPIVDLPAVGTNLQDHVFLGISWFVNSTDTEDDIKRNTTLASLALDQWMVNGTGPMGLGPASQLSWLRVPNSKQFFRSLGVEDPSAGPTSAHFELIPTNGYISKRVPLPADGHFFSFVAAVISPTSRGNVSLASADPFAAPLINPNLLGSPVDVAIMREAIKQGRAFLKAPAWAGYILDAFGALADAHTDEELDAFIHDNSDTVDHPVGTVPMGKGRAGALEPDLRVKGTVGLRVVDASAFPFIPSGHTQGPTYILAERAAALVRASLLF